MNDRLTPSSQPQQAVPPEAPADRDQIAERAYYRYVERGRADGGALEDWLGAETEVRKDASGPAE